jgi:hypothetical protein
MNHTYTAELEYLVLNTLLPEYIKYQKAKGVVNPYQGLNEDLLAKLKVKKQLPALLRPKENLS